MLTMRPGQEMEAAAVALVEAVAGNPAPGSHPNIRNINTNRNLIGTTHREAGTLWMGPPGHSVTDSFGKFLNIDNAYVAGPALDDRDNPAAEHRQFGGPDSFSRPESEQSGQRLGVGLGQ